MIADYFTKPLQGGLFKRIRDQIVGTSSILAEERVENGNSDEDETNKLAAKIIENDKIKRTRTYTEAVTQNIQRQKDLKH